MSRSVVSFAEYFHGGKVVFGRHRVACPPSAGDKIRVRGRPNFMVKRVKPEPLRSRGSVVKRRRAPLTLFRVYLELADQ